MGNLADLAIRKLETIVEGFFWMLPNFGFAPHLRLVLCRRLDCSCEHHPRLPNDEARNQTSVKVKT